MWPLQPSIDVILRKKQKNKQKKQKQTANKCFTVNEHLLWWIQAYLMNTDWCPEAINMFPERCRKHYKGKERESSQAIAKPTEGPLTWDSTQHTVDEIHSSHSSQMTGNEETRVQKQRKLEDETKKQIERQGEGEQRDETKGGENVPRWQGIRWDV